MPRKQKQAEQEPVATALTPNPDLDSSPESTEVRTFEVPAVEVAPAPPDGERHRVFYHVGQGSKSRREAVLAVPLEASDDLINRMQNLVTKLGAAFPEEKKGGVNAWYNSSFVSAYLSVSTPARLGALLVAMAKAGHVDFSTVTVTYGKKWAGRPLVEMVEKDKPFVEWLSEQSGDQEALQLLVMANAYANFRDNANAKGE